MRTLIRLQILSIVAFGAAPFPAQGQDARGSFDHPVVSRYPGSRIQGYQQVDFDRYRLALAVENNAPAGVTQLTGSYGIAADRLTALGVGPLAPVASNRTEEGKARNRRVDLVER